MQTKAGGGRRSGLRGWSPAGLPLPFFSVATGALVIGALIGCAKVGAPSGGPIDKTPPAVIRHTPSDAATGVSRGQAVELTFSEEMDRVRVEEALFIAPSVAYKARWAGRRLRLEFADSLETDRTYVLTVGTGARDRRNNALPSAFTLAFATGDRLNKGVLRGAVYREHRPAGTVHVWAYAVGSEKGAAGRDWEPGLDPPQYQTQTDASGAFEFSRLSAGRYLLCAFADSRRNGAWDKGEELALPAAAVGVGEEEEAVAGDLLLQARGGSKAAQLERLQALDRRRLLLYFAADVVADSVHVEVEGLAIEAVYGGADDQRKVYAVTAVQEAGREYGVRLDIDGQALGEGAVWRGSGRADTQAPQVAAFEPALGAVSPDVVPAVSFDEPMRAVAPQGRLVAVEAEAEAQVEVEIPGTWRWAGPLRLEFVPIGPLSAGGYRLEIDPASLADLEGLALADSVFQWAFEVAAAQSLARVRGRIVGAGDQVPTAVLLGKGGMYHRVCSTDGRFDFEALPPGEYILYGFVDGDGDGRVGGGRVEPFVPAEAYARRVEALELEAGAIIEGIELVLR